MVPTKDLRVKYVPIGDVRPYEDNPRRNDGAVQAVVNSLREFGWKQPIVVDADGTIVVGHTRYKAALALEMTHVPVVVASDLTPEQCAAYRLADNRVGELAEWDMDLLAQELDGLADIDMSAYGFDSDELSSALGDVAGAKTAEIDDVEPDEDAPSSVKTGQIWMLGRHRLMCGDSTDASAVSRLMNGHRADICFTSPPYNAGTFQVGTSSGEMYVKKNRGSMYDGYSDDLSDSDYCDFLCKSLDAALAVSDDVLFNIGFTSGAIRGTAEFIGRNAKRFGGAIIWKKTAAFPPFFPSQFGIMANVCEPIYVFNAEGTRKLHHPQWGQGDYSVNLIETKNASTSNDYAGSHEATFPVELPAEALSRFCGGSVLDVFGGTGTTMIAAEQLGKTCYMMELDPRYCDIIIDRWERLTGKTAVRVDE